MAHDDEEERSEVIEMCSDTRGTLYDRKPKAIVQEAPGVNYPPLLKNFNVISSKDSGHKTLATISAKCS
jgi:hypothetical protein